MQKLPTGQSVETTCLWDAQLQWDIYITFSETIKEEEG